MSNSNFNIETQSAKLHAMFGSHHHRHEHTLSPVDLTLKLEQLQMNDKGSSNSRGILDGHRFDQDDNLLHPEGEIEGEDDHRSGRSRHRSHSRHHHSRSHSRHHSRQRTTIDPELQKWSHETLHEILDHLEHQRREAEFFHESRYGAEPGMEDNGGRRMRHTQDLSPEILKDLSLNRSLKQSHGLANLRHG